MEEEAQPKPDAAAVPTGMGKYGKVERIVNQDPLPGSAAEYLRVWVRLGDGAAPFTEEQWLLTDGEVERFAGRPGPRGAGEERPCGKVFYGFAEGSIGVWVRMPGDLGERAMALWVISDGEIAKVRERVKKNPEDLQAAASASPGVEA